MRRYLYLALGLLAGACVPARAKVAPAPTPPEPAACGKGDAAGPIYVVDGKPVTCRTAMSLPTSRIATVEVLKGEAAVSLYGPLAAAGVVVIQTRDDR